MKNLGLRLAMDDFGTGYSSLSFLAELPIDILKVAKPFTEGLGRSERDTAFAEAIVPLGRTVGMQINAETPSPRDSSYVEHLLRLGTAPEDRKIIPFPA